MGAITSSDICNSGVLGYSASPVRRQNKYTRYDKCIADVLPVFVKMSTTVTCVGDFERMLVPELKWYLMDREITCSIYRKVALVRLCQTVG